MFKPKTFLDIVMAMKTGATVILPRGTDKFAVQGQIISINKEDGSGYSWNITLSNTEYGTVTVFFRE